MRYVLAIAALVLAGVLLILGIGQRTFLAGPAEISFPVETNSEAGYAIVSESQLAKIPGQANIVVKGSEGFVATGATRDVEAWLEPFLHAELSVDKKQKRLLSGLVAPMVSDATDGANEANAGEATADAELDEAAQGLDPRGSDLWLEERSMDKQEGTTETEMLRVPVALASDQSVLIASNGEEPIPADVSLTWVQDRQTPWAGPLLAAGGLFAVVGAVLYLLAIDHDRRGLGPRRGRRGPLQGIRNTFSGRAKRRGEDSAPQSGSAASMRATRRVALPALGIAIALGLSGCSANYWPSFGADEPVEEVVEEPSSAVAPVPVTDAQLDRIVERIATVSGEGDDSLDPSVLESRFTGDALAQRSANYAIRAALPDYAVIPPRITNDELDYELVQSTESWPRTVLVTVASSAGSTSGETAGEESATDETSGEEEVSPSLAMVLTQKTPQDNYLVSRIVALRGGISMPQAAPAEDGTALLANDIESLVLAPGEVGEAFAAVLQGGTEVEEADLFDLTSESLLESYGKVRAEKSQQDSDAKDQTMVFSVTAAQGEERPVALSTGVGGALVATTVIEEQVVDAAGGRFKPQAAGAVTALSGLEGEQETLVQQVSHQLLFFVPSKADGSKIQLLGVSSELVGVRN